jgi:cytochrome P450
MEIEELASVESVIGPGWGRDLQGAARALLGADRRGLLRAAPDVVLAFRHDDVRALAVHPDVGNTPTSVLMERAGRRNASETSEGGFAPIIANQVFTFNPPLHTETRRILTRQFMPGNVGRLAPLATDVIDGVLTALAGRGTFDLVTAVAEPVSARFWGRLIGMTTAEMDEMQALLPVLSTVFLAELSGEQRGALDAAVRRYMALVTTAAGESQAGERPCDDVGLALLAEMAADLAAVASPGAPRDIGHLAAGNFFDGFHTVGVGLANAAAHLLARPVAWARVVAEPSLASAAYDEGTRLAPPLVLTHRWLLAEVVHGGVRLPPGTLVAMHWGAANLDPAVFDRPDDHVLDRSPRGLLTFGTGPHLCPGRNIARLVGELALRRLTERFPRLGLTGQGARRRERLRSAAAVRRARGPAAAGRAAHGSGPPTR